VESSILIYCDQITSRIEYVFHLILNIICGFEYKLTTDKEEYKSFDGIHINYSKEKIIGKEIHFLPSGLLQEIGIEKKQVEIVKEDSSHIMYVYSSKTDHQIFDPFTAAFFLVSRYEEYLPYKPDKFNRFEAEASVLYKYNILDQPLINEWAYALRENIIQGFPEVKITRNTFKAEISIDIDQAFAFKCRGLKLNTISFLNNIFHGRKDLLQHQIQSILYNKPDPFDTYEFLKKAQDISDLPFIYFINVGKYSRYDKNLSPDNPKFKSLLKNINTHAEIGLHPSYFANEQTNKFGEEKTALEILVEKKITKSRQHYLKLQFPHTYRNLLNAGITNDYSMGYASRPGFRAGTCTPFNWFDLESNSVTDLKVYPISFMDGSLGEDLQMSPAEANNYIKNITKTIKQFDGYYLSVWHNHTINDKFYWRGWKDVFEQSLQLIK
jgi:hypothetical protein